MPRTPIGHNRKLDKPSRIHLIPALTVIVFMRRYIGGRILSLRWVVPTAAALYFIQPLSGRNLDDWSLRIFAVAFLALSLMHRLHYEIVRARRGAVWHSYDRGRSWLSFLPLPEFLLHLVIDPLLCGYLGFRILPYSWRLGAWVMLAAGMMWLTEFHDYRHSYHRDHDVIDGEVESRLQAEAIRKRQARGAGAEMDVPAPVIAVRRPGGIFTRLRR